MTYISVKKIHTLVYGIHVIPVNRLSHLIEEIYVFLWHYEWTVLLVDVLRSSRSGFLYVPDSVWVVSLHGLVSFPFLSVVLFLPLGVWYIRGLLVELPQDVIEYRIKVLVVFEQNP